MDQINKFLTNSNPHSTTTFQFIVSLCLGIILSPWSWGFLFFILFLTGYEIFISFVTPKDKWNMMSRVLIVIASLLGFIIGRLIIGHNNPFDDYSSSSDKSNDIKRKYYHEKIMKYGKKKQY